MTSYSGEADAILLRAEGSVAVLTLNRPTARNAIDDAMRAELMAALDHVARTDSIKALVVTGAGKGFCAGGDVKSMQARLSVPPGEVALNGWRRQQRTHHAISMLHSLPKPTIAAVNGAATGLGCDVALCCDFIIASDDARFAMSYILRGLIPDGGGMYFLPRRVGLSRAKELIFTGRTVEPEEALRIGMIDRVTGAARLLEDACNWATELSHGAPAALALGKNILDQTFELSVEQVFSLGSQAQAICYSSREHQESVAAFLEGVAQRRAAQGKGGVA
ncbi:enoyl-CoA hydratase/isomerase family protein [Teichococcus vastitatis]|uniref:Enoyl-CoA hydratase/isomerase family protein n=1 Tax=Teichococcus vastitatis TaxID=2307076 RepID=A0ABS9W1B0_9PROT|nr:enoyl-CoA hydratase/isomerase family protein [Pseudoroseomonas vastitatis]MCI0753080.1 enoyl-CoA hydratase/isomerase family protein [Pseudoroseomonas vastitatis]